MNLLTVLAGSPCNGSCWKIVSQREKIIHLINDLCVSLCNASYMCLTVIISFPFIKTQTTEIAILECFLGNILYIA